jgi:hypothetical protein
MDTASPMSGPPPLPGERELPDSLARRRELLAMIAADRRAPRVPRWAVALAAAAAVAGVAVTAGSLLPALSSSPPASTGPDQPAGTSVRGGLPGCTAPRGAQCHRTQSHTVTATLRALIVRDPVGSVTVTGSSRSSVLVTERISYSGAPPAISQRTSDGTLSLTDTCRSGNCGISYDVAVPRSLNVQVQTGTGSIWLSSLAGQVRAAADVGSLHGQGLTSGLAVLSANTGSIEAVFATAPARLSATSEVGAVTIRVPAGTSYAVAAHTDVGAVHVSVPRAASARHVIDASTNVGSVTVAGS